MIRQISMRYDNYCNSEIVWIREYPEHWKFSRVKNLGILSRGVDLPRESFEDGHYPVYGSNGVIGYHSKYTTKGPCVIVGRSGSVGEVNYTESNFWAHNTALYLQKSFRNEVKYIFYRLKSLNLQSVSAGSAVGTLNRNIIHQLETAIPPVSEQKAIANYLDDKTAKIDHQIDLFIKKAKLFDEFKQALINETVTRGIDKTALMKDSGIEWIGKVPAHWEVKRIKEIFVESKSVSTFGDEVLLAVSEYTGVTQKRDNIEANELLTNAATLVGYKICHIGDLVINIMLAWKRGLGVSPYHGIVSPSYAVFKPKKQIDSKYFHYRLRNDDAITEFKRNSTGIIESRLRLYPDSFYAISLAVPPIEEQTKIAAYLDDKTAKIDQIVVTINQQIENLKELRKTLINDVVTGKIKVTQDDNNKGLTA